MPTFMTTGRLTQSGLQGLAKKPEDRSEAVGKLLAAAGGKLMHYYITTGDNDFLLISEADGPEAPVAAVMAAACAGSVADVKTMQVWTSAEFQAVAAKAGQITGTYRAPGKS
jgi:uncharacterized protein with GYD domain